MAWSMRNAKRRWKGVKFKDTPMGKKWARRWALAVLRCSTQYAVAQANISAMRSAPAETPIDRARKNAFIAQAVIDTHLGAADTIRRTMRGEI